MKTKILTITLLALMMGISLTSNAGNDDTIQAPNHHINAEFQASINLFPDNIVKFHVVKPEQEKVKLRVYDANGTILYSYCIKKHHIARIGFDINTLEAGNYEFVIVRNKAEILRKTISKR